jgi:MoxR-like ATPase
VPGLGKTLLVRALAKTLDCGYARVQFTPDLMPSDISGHAVYDPKTETFNIRRGPVFTNLLLADEINRAPAKTQSALLEAMQELQVTIEGHSFELPPPFLTLATQNPVEHEGHLSVARSAARSLPAQGADRLSLARRREEDGGGGEPGPHGLRLRPVAGAARGRARGNRGDALGTALVTVDDAVIDYAVRIAPATRDWAGIALGAGPRGSLALVRAARAQAVLAGRDFVTPDDVREIAKPGVAPPHRAGAGTADRRPAPDDVLHALLSKVEAPRQ